MHGIRAVSNHIFDAQMQIEPALLAHASRQSPEPTDEAPASHDLPHTAPVRCTTQYTPSRTSAAAPLPVAAAQPQNAKHQMPSEHEFDASDSQHPASPLLQHFHAVAPYCVLAPTFPPKPFPPTHAEARRTKHGTLLRGNAFPTCIPFAIIPGAGRGAAWPSSASIPQTHVELI